MGLGRGWGSVTAESEVELGRGWGSVTAESAVGLGRGWGSVTAESAVGLGRGRGSTPRRARWDSGEAGVIRHGSASASEGTQSASTCGSLTPALRHRRQTRHA